MTTPLRDHVLQQVREFWQDIAAQPDDDGIMGTPPDDITFFEYENADFEEAMCSGAYMAIETIDRSGQTHSPLASDPQKLIGMIRGAYWQHAQARFHVSDAMRSAILEIVVGPRYARGFRYTVLPDGSIQESNAWIS